MTTNFESEIRSQGELLRARADGGAEAAARIAEAWRGLDYALVAARGSSDNAARFFQYLAGQRAGLVVALAAPSLFEGVRVPGLRGAGVLAISQSGRSPGMIDVIRAGREQGRPTGAITNSLDSPLALESDVVIDLGVGPELAIASTKTFTATWHALGQIVSALGSEPLDGLDATADAVGEVIEWALGAEMPVELIDAPRGLTMVGRGVGYATACEIALKVREVSGLRAEAFAAPDYLHGPIGADATDTALTLILTDELSDAVAEELLATGRALGARTLVIRPRGRHPLGADVDLELPFGTPNWLTGLLEVVVGQVLTLRLGERRGRSIDSSPVLSKVTTSA